MHGESMHGESIHGEPLIHTFWALMNEINEVLILLSVIG